MSDSITKYDEMKQIKNIVIDNYYEMYNTFKNEINKANLPKPKSQLQEVLYMLLTRNSINIKQMMFDTGILNLSARISDLRNIYFINIYCKKINTENKFGRKVSYGKWNLTNKEYAKEIYFKMINNDRL